MHTQTDFLERVDALRGKTVLTVKKNQPTLYADLMTYFADPLATYEQDSTYDDQRGRSEVRSIQVSTEINPFGSYWPHLDQVAKLTRTGTVRGTNQTTQEIVSLITDFDPSAASPVCLLEPMRGHWSIGNLLHPGRDVTKGSDRSQILSGNAPQVMAALRNLVIALMHRHGSDQIAFTRRQFAHHPRRALKLLLQKRHTEQSFTDPAIDHPAP
jgi:predicted transposase YbfD/YdcC